LGIEAGIKSFLWEIAFFGPFWGAFKKKEKAPVSLLALYLIFKPESFFGLFGLLWKIRLPY